MRHRVRDVEEERLLGRGALADERDGLPRVRVGERGRIGLLHAPTLAIPQRQLLRRLHERVLVVVAVEQAHEPVEGVVERPRPRLVAEMPLADRHGAVAGAVQHLRQRDVVARAQADLAARRERRADADAERVATRQQRRTRRRARGRWRVGARGAHALARHGVEVRRAVHGVAVRRKVAVSHVVGEDDDDVGARGRGGRLCLRHAGEREPRDREERGKQPEPSRGITDRRTSPTATYPGWHWPTATYPGWHWPTATYPGWQWPTATNPKRLRHGGPTSVRPRSPASACRRGWPPCGWRSLRGSPRCRSRTTPSPSCRRAR